MFEKEIARGMAVLDQYHPGWEDHIDPDHLMMSCTSFPSPQTGGCGCILAQVDAIGKDYGFYDEEVTNLLSMVPPDNEERISGISRRYRFTSTHGFTVASEHIMHLGSAEEVDRVWKQLDEEWKAAIRRRREEKVNA